MARNAVVFSAIDNLVKGAAGQAVQNMNLMFGLPGNDRLDVYRKQSVIYAILLKYNNLKSNFQLATYKKMGIAVETRPRVHGFGPARVTNISTCTAAMPSAPPGIRIRMSSRPSRQQAEKVIFYSNLVYSETRARAAEKLVSIAPNSLTQAFFATPAPRPTRTRCAWRGWPRGAKK